MEKRKIGYWKKIVETQKEGTLTNLEEGRRSKKGKYPPEELLF